MIASYLVDWPIWRDVLPIPIFAAFVSYCLTLTVREDKENQKKAFMLLFSLALLGLTTGQLTGQSREPAVEAVVPSALALIGGIIVYLVAAKNIQQQLLVALMVIAFSINLLVGTFWGTRLRLDHEDYLLSESYRVYQEVVNHNVQLQRIKHEKQLSDVRKIIGLKQKECMNFNLQKYLEKK